MADGDTVLDHFAELRFGVGFDGPATLGNVVGVAAVEFGLFALAAWRPKEERATSVARPNGFSGRAPHLLPIGPRITRATDRTYRVHDSTLATFSTAATMSSMSACILGNRTYSVIKMRSRIASATGHVPGL